MKITKMLTILSILIFSAVAARAEYRQVNLTVFGMDCAPCAHAIHVSMKGIPGVTTVNVDLNTGLVGIKLAPGNHADMHQFNQAVEKNGFTHKDANVVVLGKITGSTSNLFLEVSGTKDRYALAPLNPRTNASSYIGKTVTVEGTIPQAPKGKVPDTLRYKTITEAQ